MSARGRLIALAAGVVAAALVGCGDGGSGISDSRIRSALEMKSIQGRLAIQSNPFCSVSKLLTDVNQVKDASSTGLVISSRDHTVGVQIIKPFAPGCRNFAERKLDKLARSPKKHKQGKGTQNGGKKKGGGGDGNQA
jgi:hypothetical protein